MHHNALQGFDTWSTHGYCHADGGGNVTYLVNSSQGLAASYKYDAYGNLVSQSGSLAGANVYRFSSKEHHAASGLCYYGCRWYSPNLQRWPNRDPINELGFNLLRHRQNLFNLDEEKSPYTFVQNNPIKLVDPLGNVSWGWPVVPPPGHPPTFGPPPPPSPPQAPEHMGFPSFRTCMDWCMRLMNPWMLPQAACVATSVFVTGSPAIGATAGAGWTLGTAAGCAFICAL